MPIFKYFDYLVPDKKAKPKNDFGCLLYLPFPAWSLSCLGEVKTNKLLQKILGYENQESIDQNIFERDFLKKHFRLKELARLIHSLRKNKVLEDFCLTIYNLQGEELKLFLTISSDFNEKNQLIQAEGFFKNFDEISLELKKLENSKNEFLSNISHELRTPLNIINGMISLALTNDSIPEEVIEQLEEAKKSAADLLELVEDLIALSYLEVEKKADEKILFTLNMLQNNLQAKFQSKADKKNIDLIFDLQEKFNSIIEANYNYITKALEKVIDNAIKFSPHGSFVKVIFEICQETESIILIEIHDNGPGLPCDLIVNDNFFNQGDGSITRSHGGLGLGLKLAHKLLDSIGGILSVLHTKEQGASFKIKVPVLLHEN